MLDHARLLEEQYATTIGMTTADPFIINQEVCMGDASAAG